MPELRNDNADKVMSLLEPQLAVLEARAAPRTPDDDDGDEPDASRAGGTPDPSAPEVFDLRPHRYAVGERVRLLATHTFEQTLQELDPDGAVSRTRGARRRTRLSAVVTVLAVTSDGRPAREEYLVRRCDLTFGGQVRSLLPSGARVHYDRFAKASQRLRLADESLRAGATLSAQVTRVLLEVITAGRDDLQGGALLTPPTEPLFPGAEWPLPVARLSQRLIESAHLRARGLSGKAKLAGARVAAGVPCVHVAARLSPQGVEFQDLPEGLHRDETADPSEVRAEILLGALLPRGDQQGGEGALEIRAETPAIRYVGDDRRQMRLRRVVTVQQRVRPSPPSDVGAAPTEAVKPAARAADPRE